MELINSMDKLKKVIYICNSCSDRKYKEVYKAKKPSLAAQKYHKLMIEGLNSNVDVIVLSSLAITRDLNKKLIFFKDKEKIDNTEYIYLPFINIPILRHLCLIIFSIFNIIKIYKKDKNVVIISDILNISMAFSAIVVSKLTNLKTVGIVTDVPGFLSNNSKKIINKIINKINWLILKQFSAYLFLTEQMNELINKNKKPYIVIEGQVDLKMQNIKNLLRNKSSKKICLYAGSLKKVYGIKILVEGFVKANVSNSELHIYGDGDFKDELQKLVKKNQNLKYLGVVDNETIVKEQLKATLLVNPRPTKEEYTKYSFPSKNMEYMVSGTSVLTTKLPGMPKSYENYVYLIEEESPEGICKNLQDILSKSSDELHEKGLQTREYVLKNKNNIVQAEHLLNMIKNNLVRGD